jgi:hypothetical protein
MNEMDRIIIPWNWDPLRSFWGPNFFFLVPWGFPDFRGNRVMTSITPLRSIRLYSNLLVLIFSEEVDRRPGAKKSIHSTKKMRKSFASCA